MRKKILFQVVCMSIIMTAPAAAMAAPFCLSIRGVAPQCDYADAAQCRDRARALQAVCTLNEAEIKIPPGIGNFCVVDSSRAALCIYIDRGSCEDEAQRKNAVCVDNTPVPVQPDPHQSNPQRSY